MTTPAVTRVAPSPTGDPHVGTAYIALFDLLAARSTGGRFILRIEDTDQTRYDATSEAQIIEALHWLGLGYDEGPDVGGPNGPYRQSERTAIYRDHVQKLLENGTAYRCFCSEERLTEMRHQQRARKAPPGYDGLCRSLLPEDIAKNLDDGLPFTVRLKVPKDRTIRFHDELRGPIEIEGRTIDDQVLLKSDGFPTYHLANVVDDHLMEVTEVIRAEEWITSTPKHVLLYEAFGWEAPRFRHMPLLRNSDRSKISKRKNPTSLIWYKENGFLPEAMINFLALMGYSLPDGREVFTRAELEATYDASRISTSGPVFDLEKLTWLNGEHIRRLAADDLAARIVDHVAYRAAREAPVRPGHDDALHAWAGDQGGLEGKALRDLVRRAVPITQERIKTLDEWSSLARCFFLGTKTDWSAEDLVPKGRDAGATHDVLSLARQHLAALPAWELAGIEATLRTVVDESGWKPRELFQAVRVATTGSKVSPPLFESLEILGRETSLARLATT
ncbi:MAG: glutamate--tRNA ligase [Planctomycetota bacterium]